jgi:MFS family permease
VDGVAEGFASGLEPIIAEGALRMAAQKSWAYWVVGYAILALMVGTNLPSPLYQLYMQKWGFSPSTLTAIFACYAFFLIPSLLIFGRLTDRIGRKPIIIIGLLLAALGIILFIVAQDANTLFAARAVQGIAVGAVSGAATAALIELHPTGDRRSAALVTTLATAGGTAVGPLLSGAIAEYTGHPLNAPFYTEMSLLAPAIIAVMLIPETVGKIASAPAVAQQGTQTGTMFDRRSFFIAGASAFVAWSVAALFMSLMPSYVSKLLDVRYLLVGGGTIFCMLTLSVAAQLGLRGIVPKRSIRIGLSMLSIGLCVIVYSVIEKSIALFGIGTVLCGLGHGMTFGGATVLVNMLASPTARGRILSLYYVIIYLGVGVPILLTGWLASRGDLRFSASVFTAMIVVVSLIITMLFPQRMNPTKI